MHKKYVLLTFEGNCMNFSLFFFNHFKSPSDLKTALQNRPNTYASPCTFQPCYFSFHGRKDVYNHASQTIPPGCRMLVLGLDTPLFGENVCVHYNLSNSFIISTKVPSAYLASLLRIEERSVSVMDKGQKFMLYLTISNHDTE